MSTILKLFDETKDLFRSSFYKEMVLLLDDPKRNELIFELNAQQLFDLLEDMEQEIDK